MEKSRKISSSVNGGLGHTFVAATTGGFSVGVLLGGGVGVLVGGGVGVLVGDKVTVALTNSCVVAGLELVSVGVIAGAEN